MADEMAVTRGPAFPVPHPGEHLREDVLPALDMTIKDLAGHLGVSRVALSELINERRGISVDMAQRLGKALGNGARFWLALQMQYDLWHAERRAKIEVKPLRWREKRPGERAATRAWCERLLAMYRAWAGNRHMQLAELAGMAAHDLPLLIVSGFGAHRLLEKEAGLHVLERAGDEKGRSRSTARVRLAVTPPGDLPPERLRRALAAALEEGGKPHAVVRRYRGPPSPLVRNMNGAWRTGRLDAVLAGDFDLIAASLAAGE